MLIVDAHEDLAWNMLSFGRDYTRSVTHIRAGETNTPIPDRVGQAMLGWPDWLHGQVGLIFATLYACPGRRAGKYATLSYTTAEEAHRLYHRQLNLYRDLVATHPDKFYLITSRTDLETGLQHWRAAPPARRRIGLVLLMEGADGVRHPDELAWWFEQGLRILGPAWGRTRYAGGTGEPGPFTRLGQNLLERMAETGMILDLSHLTDEGVTYALAHYPGPIIASHSNARALLPHNTPGRHLGNRAIRHLAGRQGVIGLVLPHDFVKDRVKLGSPRHLVTLDDVVDQIDYMAQLVGHCGHLGLGSDLDGGVGQEHSPEGLDSIADLPNLAGVLDRRGYPPADIEAILGGNWLNFLRWALPETA